VIIFALKMLSCFDFITVLHFLQLHKENKRRLPVGQEDVDKLIICEGKKLHLLFRSPEDKSLIEERKTLDLVSYFLSFSSRQIIIITIGNRIGNDSLEKPY
jgi:hypothetical protein